MEDGPGYKGTRLFVTKVREEKDTKLLYSIRRRSYPSEKENKESLFLKRFVNSLCCEHSRPPGA